MERQLTFKYHCYHFYLLREQMKDIVEVSLRVQRSDIDDIWRIKSWVINAQLLLLKYNNYYKDWNKAKVFCDNPEIVNQVDKAFANIHKKWPDIDDFRNEVISHAFTVGINGSRIRTQSMFALEEWKVYGIPEESNDYIRLHNKLAEITEFLKSKYSEDWKEFEDGIFPLLPGNTDLNQEQE